jgi:hypothetical protein
LGPGQLTLFENNAFNTYAGVFATNEYASPLRLSGGGTYLAAATPLTPRTIFASYTMAVGGPAPGPSFRQFARASAARVAQAPTPAPNPSPSANPRRFQRFTSNPPPPGTDPLALATARETCDAGAQSDGKPIYDALHAYVAAYEKSEKTPDVPHLTIAAHKTAAGSAVPYFLELRPNLPRPANGGQTGPSGARRDTFGGGGPGGPGGEPGGPGPGGPGPGGPGPGGPGGPGEFGGGGTRSGEAPIRSGDVVAQSETASSATRTPEQEAARRNFQNSPDVKAFRGFIGCAYVTLLSQADAKAKGIELPGGRPGLLYVPGVGIAFVQALELPQGGGSLKSK